MNKMEERIIYKHVAVIGMDGMGNFCKDTDTPNMDRIFENGATTYYGLSMVPTISAENWGAMLIGAKPVVHGLTNSIAGSREYTNKALPSIFTQIRKARPDAVLSSFSNWNPINHGIIEHDINVRLETADNDTLLCEKIIPAVADKPDFLFVQFDEPDGEGHHSGYGKADQLKKITETDALVGRIYDEYINQGIIDDTLFIVLADHGGRIRSHGGYSDTEKYIFAGVSGRGIVKSEIDYMQTRDIASIVLYALGVDIPEYNEEAFSSQIPAGIFPWYDGEYIKIEAHPYNPLFKETPAYKGEKGLTSFFDEESIKLACFFDNNLEDAAGKCRLREYGICKYYSDGIRNERIELGKTGFAQVEGLKLGTESFTFSLWIKIDRSLAGEPVLFANKNFVKGDRDGSGVALALRCADTLLNVGCPDDNIDVNTPVPENISDGWFHGVYVIDKEKAEIRIYHNFRLCHTMTLDPQFMIDFDGMPFMIGNDSTSLINGYVPETIVNIDDLFVFSKAFDENDVEKLAKYYE